MLFFQLLVTTGLLLESVDELATARQAHTHAQACDNAAMQATVGAPIRQTRLPGRHWSGLRPFASLGCEPVQGHTQNSVDRIGETDESLCECKLTWNYGSMLDFQNFSPQLLVSRRCTTGER